MRLAERLALACLAALAGGCASTPAEVMAEGPRSEHALQLSPARAAGCIARNAENMVDSIQAPMRPLESGERYEVIVRNMNAQMLRPILMIAIVEPRGPGARVTFHGPGYGFSPPRDEFVALLTKGC